MKLAPLALNSVRDRISYVRSLLITAPLIGIYTAVMGSISVVCSFFIHRQADACARIWSRMIWTSEFRYLFEVEQHPAGRFLCVLRGSSEPHGYSNCPCCSAGPIRFLAKKQLFEIPFLDGIFAVQARCLSIGKPRAAVKSLRAAVAQIQQGTPVVIFPEGGTSEDGVIHPFKGGGFFLATQSLVDVIPVTVRGSLSGT